MKLYLYGMKERHCSIGAQPREDFCERQDDPSGKYQDIISYRRKLTQEEIETYALDFLREEELEEDPIYTTIELTPG